MSEPQFKEGEDVTVRAFGGVAGGGTVVRAYKTLFGSVRYDVAINAKKKSDSEWTSLIVTVKPKDIYRYGVLD